MGKLLNTIKENQTNIVKFAFGSGQFLSY